VAGNVLIWPDTQISESQFLFLQVQFILNANFKISSKIFLAISFSVSYFDFKKWKALV